MRRHFCVISGLVGLFCVIVGSRAWAELDFSPESVSVELDGIKMSQLTFRTGASSKASYQAPRDWKCSGGKDHLDLQPPDLSQVNAKITKLSASEAISFDAAGREELKKKAITSLPEGSQDVKLLSEELDPLQIDGNHTYLVELSYVFFGEKFACYSLILDRKPEAVSFRLSCREKDYPGLRQAFQRSLYTWQNL
jgi:hypothetical protein